MKRSIAGLLTLALVLTFSTLTLAQDKMGKEMKKDDKAAMSKSEMKMGAMKSFSCDESCGYMCKSHDEGELVESAMKHVKKHHADLKVTKKDVMGMVKTEEEKK